MNVDFSGVCDELKHVERILSDCKTDEERVFAYMYIINIGKTLQQACGAIVNELSAKCVERIEPKVK